MSTTSYSRRNTHRYWSRDTRQEHMRSPRYRNRSVDRYIPNYANGAERTQHSLGDTIMHMTAAVPHAEVIPTQRLIEDSLKMKDTADGDMIATCPMTEVVPSHRRIEDGIRKEDTAAPDTTDISTRTPVSPRDCDFLHRHRECSQNS